MVDILAKEESNLSLIGQLEGEVAFVIVKGAIKLKQEEVKSGQMLISKTDEACEIFLAKGSQVLLFGGKPLDEERYLLWNFVSHSKERLKKARADWENKKFPVVPGDNTYIPYPNSQK
jgi:redox-sensitive bicupin YhaK (pirin superfamily)